MIAGYAEDNADEQLIKDPEFVQMVGTPMLIPNLVYLAF